MSSLLDDLDDLGDEPDEEEEEAPSASAAAAAASSSTAHHRDGADNDDDDDDDDDPGAAGAGAGASSAAAAALHEEPGDAALEAQLAALPRRTGYRSVARLRDTPRFAEHMARVAAALAAPAVPQVAGALEAWPEYQLIVASNAMAASLDDEFAALHGYIAAAYAPRFPELANILPSPPDYIRVVAAIGNETDMTAVEALPALLPSAQVMVVTVTGSVTDGRPLAPDALADVLAACAEARALEDAKARVLSFVESRMAAMAPNTSALLGTAVAARLVGIAGGLVALSRIPSCNIQVVGQKRRGGLAGFSRLGGLGAAAAAPVHVGVVYDADLVQGAPSALRRKVVKLLAAKVVLAARVDAFQQAPDGALGAGYRAAVAARVAKLQEPPPGQTKRPLPAPEDKPSKKRGGRRARKLKEKLGLTDVRREASRLTFATTHDEYSDLSMGRDHGRLGSHGTGKLRVERKDQSGLVSKKRKLYGGGSQQGGGYLGGGSGATGGVSSSLAFTPGQGLELSNPAAAAARASRAGESAGYFSATGAFSVRPK